MVTHLELNKSFGCSLGSIFSMYSVTVRTLSMPPCIGVLHLVIWAPFLMQPRLLNENLKQTLGRLYTYIMGREPCQFEANSINNFFQWRLLCFCHWFLLGTVVYLTHACNLFELNGIPRWGKILSKFALFLIIWYYL